MRKVIILILFAAASTQMLSSQVADTINRTDSSGMKQGYWRVDYPNGRPLYKGYFVNDRPVGEFRRFYEDGTLRALMNHLENGRDAEATFFHPNGNIAAKGLYVNQKREGTWRLFSEQTENYLVGKESYKNNLRHGISLKFYRDSTVAEKVYYQKGVRHGEWKQYYSNGNRCIVGNYKEGRLHGDFTVYFLNGTYQYIGRYSDNTRDGTWKVFDEEGELQFEMIYSAGVLKNREEVIERENQLLDFLERNRGRISDPEITGTIWDW